MKSIVNGLNRIFKKHRFLVMTFMSVFFALVFLAISEVNTVSAVDLTVNGSGSDQTIYMDWLGDEDSSVDRSIPVRVSSSVNQIFLESGSTNCYIGYDTNSTNINIVVRVASTTGYSCRTSSSKTTTTSAMYLYLNFRKGSVNRETYTFGADTSNIFDNNFDVTIVISAQGAADFYGYPDGHVTNKDGSSIGGGLSNSYTSASTANFNFLVRHKVYVGTPTAYLYNGTDVRYSSVVGTFSCSSYDALESGWASWHYCKVNNVSLPEGTLTWQIRAWYGNGSRGSQDDYYTINNLIVDRTAPTISTFTVTGNSDALAGYTKTTSVSYSISASDNIGIYYYQVYDGSTTINSWTSSKPTSGTLTSTTGSKSVKLTVHDRAGNSTTKTYTICYDPSAPSISSFSAIGNSAAISGYTNTTSITYSITATDSISSAYYYQVVDGSTTIYSKSTTKPTSDTLGSSTTGNHSLTLTVWDKAGNSATKAYTIYYDPPTNTPSISTFTVKGNSAAQAGYTNTTSVAYTISASDTLSGVYYYQVVDGSTTVFTKSTTKPTSDILGSTSTGNHTLTLTIWDKAGNTSTKSYTIYYDPSSPSITTFTVTGNSDAVGGYTKTRNVTYSITASDALSGITYYQVVDGSTTMNSKSSTKPSSGQLGSATNGTHTVTLTIWDKAGNTATKNYSIVLDTVAPVITLSMTSSVTIGKNGGVYLASTSAAFNFEASDNLTGMGSSYSDQYCDRTISYGTKSATGTYTCDLSSYSVNFDSSRTVSFGLDDYAGNVGYGTYSFYYIDNSRKITIDVFRIIAKGALYYNWIGASSVTGGQIAPYYSLSNGSYIDTDYMFFAPDGSTQFISESKHTNITNIVTSGTYVTLEDGYGASKTTAQWYAGLSEGMGVYSAIFKVKNIYGQLSSSYVLGGVSTDFTTPDVQFGIDGDFSTGTNGQMYFVGNEFTLQTYWYDAYYADYAMNLPTGATYSISLGAMEQAESYQYTYFAIDVTQVAVNFDGSVDVVFAIGDRAGNVGGGRLTFYRIDTSRDLTINKFTVTSYAQGLHSYDNYIGPYDFTNGRVSPNYTLGNSAYIDTSYMLLFIGESQNNVYTPHNLFVNSSAGIVNSVPSGKFITIDGGFGGTMSIVDWYAQFNDGDVKYAMISFRNIYGRTVTKVIEVTFDFTRPVIESATILSETSTGDDGNTYISGNTIRTKIVLTELNYLMYFKAHNSLSNPNMAYVNCSLDSSASDPISVVTSRVLYFDCDISRVPVDFEKINTFRIGVEDKAGLPAETPITFIRIDDSRKPEISSFNIMAKNAKANNYIGPLSLTEGYLRPVYTASNLDYMSSFKVVAGKYKFLFQLDYVLFESTSKDNLPTSGTYYRNSNYEKLYNNYEDGDTATAYLEIRNIYGQTAKYSRTITFDFTAPTINNFTMSAFNSTTSSNYGRRFASTPRLYTYYSIYDRGGYVSPTIYQHSMISGQSYWNDDSQYIYKTVYVLSGESCAECNNLLNSGYSSYTTYSDGSGTYRVFRKLNSFTNYIVTSSATNGSQYSVREITDGNYFAFEIKTYDLAGNLSTAYETNFAAPLIYDSSPARITSSLLSGYTGTLAGNKYTNKTTLTISAAAKEMYAGININGQYGSIHYPYAGLRSDNYYYVDCATSACKSSYNSVLSIYNSNYYTPYEKFERFNSFYNSYSNQGATPRFTISSTTGVSSVSINSEVTINQVEGEHWLIIFFVDEANNISSVYEPFIYDVTKPTWSIEINEESKEGYIQFFDGYAITSSNAYIGNDFVYYMSIDTSISPFDIPAWISSPDGNTRGSISKMYLPRGAYKLYVKLTATVKDVAGNGYGAGSMFMTMVDIPVDVEYDDEHSRVDEETFNALPSKDNNKITLSNGLLIFALHSYSCDGYTAEECLLNVINDVLSGSGYSVYDLNGNSEFNNSTMLYERVILMNGQKENEMYDLMILCNNVSILNAVSSASISEVEQNAALDNIGLSYVDDKNTDVQITLDGVKVSKVDTRRAGTYSLRISSHDNMGDRATVTRTIVVKSHNNEEKAYEVSEPITEIDEKEILEVVPTVEIIKALTILTIVAIETPIVVQPAILSINEVKIFDNKEE